MKNSRKILNFNLDGWCDLQSVLLIVKKNSGGDLCSPHLGTTPNQIDTTAIT